MNRAAELVRFGQKTAHDYWWGIGRVEDVLLYRRLSLGQRVLFWWGVVRALRAIYPLIDISLVSCFGVGLVCAVVFGWGPF